MSAPESLRPAEAEALFRYRLIAPLLDPLADDDEKRRWRKWVLATEHATPDGRRRRVGERTLRRWVAAYRAGGFEALRPSARRDQGRLRRLPPAVLERAVALKREEPRRSVPHILRILAADGTPQADLPHRDTLWRHLSRLGLGTRLRPDKVGLRRFERQAPNDLWQSDVMYGPFLSDPASPQKMQRTYLVAFLDDYSRFIPHAAFYWAEDVYALELCFQQALLRRGLPRRVYVDQGLIFQSQVFTLACAQLGIRHISATAFHPEGKGKVERFFRSLQESLLLELGRRPVTTLDALNERLWAWLEEAYHKTRHEGTGQSPLQRYLSGTPSERVSPERLAEVFLWRAERRADKTGVVQFAGNRYQAPAGFERKRLHLRYHPLRLERLVVYDGDRPVGELTPLELHRPVDERVHPGHVTQAEATASYLESLLQHHRLHQAQALSPLRLAVQDEKVDR